MKKQHTMLYLGLCLLAVFIVCSGLTFHQSKRLIEEGYLASEGSAAENFAVLTAGTIVLSDEDVTALKGMSYAQLLSSEENISLKKLMSTKSFAQKVDYAYVMIHLKDEEVQYTVTEETASRFDAPIGTPLNIMWLLDVNVSDTASANSMADELDRFSYYIEEDAKIFGDKPSYIFNSSEWGDHICGYAPLYSESGNYIGVVGVELQISDYKDYCTKAIWAMGALLIVSVLTLSALFAGLYRQYRKIQYEKIYTDSLTQIYNRSYYNNVFIRKMNQKRKKYFALMIADVDLFKKVNDTFGHEVGDEVLIEAAQILSELFGRENVVRFGGEEFVVGLWLDDEKKIPLLLDELFARISEARFSTRQITLSISLGCSWCEGRELNGWLLSGMLRAADCKLYECKENGRKQYRIDHFDEKKVYKK